jgi:hypothetical protein
MYNPIIDEFVAHQQIKDRLRAVEHDRLVKAAMASHPAHHFVLRIPRGNPALSLRHIFALLVRRLGVPACN